MKKQAMATPRLLLVLPQRRSCRRLCCCGFCRCLSGSFLLRLSRSCRVRQIFVNRCGFDWMNLVIILVRFGKFLFAQKQMVKSLALTQLEVLIHLDRFEWAHLDANLAAHAD